MNAELVEVFREEVRGMLAPPSPARLPLDLVTILKAAPVVEGRQWAAQIADICIEYLDATSSRPTPAPEAAPELEEIPVPFDPALPTADPEDAQPTPGLSNETETAEPAPSGDEPKGA